MMLLPILMTVLTAVVAQNQADVLIMGAGAAGLTAAKHLAEKNVSFLIIEGASGIGGRLRGGSFSGRRVGFASSLLFGMNESISEIIDKYNITGQYIDTTSVTVRTWTGTQPDTEAREALRKLVGSQNKVLELYDKIKDGKVRDMTLRSALKYASWFPRDYIEDIRELFFYDLRFSKTPELVSTQAVYGRAKYPLVAFISPEERGQQYVLERDTMEFMEENDPRLKLNEVVKKISHTGSSVSVLTKSGKTFTGKYAIVTFSMGVLQSGSVTFEPVLPDWKLDTIYRMNMQPRTQVYVKYSSDTVKFWDDSQFILHANPRHGYYPIIFNLEAAGFYPAGTNMILFVLLGEEAKRIQRSDKAPIKAEITNVLRGIYGAGTPEPEDIYITHWLDEPLAMGSVCNKQVGDYNPRFMDALTSRIGHVYFAGEAYHDVLDGLTEGARLSGQATAMKLYDCMQNNRCPQFDPNPSPSTSPKPQTCSSSAHFLSLALFVISLIISHNDIVSWF